MAEISLRKKIWGWFFFDWASQPYNTLILTFIFGPFFGAAVAEAFMSQGLSESAAKANAQSFWALGQVIAGLIIAFSAPVLGAVADTSGNRIGWVKIFSLLYVTGAGALWFTNPDGSNASLMLVFFCVGFIGSELALIFTNSILPDLGGKKEIGEISGSGFAFGYLGGVLALFAMLLFFAEGENGKTLIGLDPAFGLLDPAGKEGQRFVGPFTAIWFALFMIPFFRWVKEPPRTHISANFADALKDLWKTICGLKRSVASYLVSSMIYRDALNGLYGFGGVYAKLVLDWPIIFIGIFGIVGAISAAIFTWVGGKADRKWGPKPVIVVSVVLLVLVCAVITGLSRESFYGFTLAENSPAPDITLFFCGAVIGAAGGALQAASRTLMVWHTNPAKPTEYFGLYALSGRSTAFLAPALIGLATTYFESNRLGITPLIALFLIGLILLKWVKPDGEQYS